MAVPDEEVGGELGAGWMIEHHYAELDPEYVLDEGGFGSRDVFADGKLVYGISVAEKKILWLRVTAEGVAGHGSQPHDQNPNDRLIRALARLLAEPTPASPVAVLDELRGRSGRWPGTSSRTRSSTPRSRSPRCARAWAIPRRSTSSLRSPRPPWIAGCCPA